MFRETRAVHTAHCTLLQESIFFLILSLTREFKNSEKKIQNQEQNIGTFLNKLASVKFLEDKEIFQYLY